MSKFVILKTKTSSLLMLDTQIAITFLVLGGITVMMIYHFILYYFNREKLLLHYNIYLFFTFLLVFFFSKFLINIFGIEQSEIILNKSKESLQILYLAFYYNFILQSVDVDKHKKTILFKLWRFFFFSLIAYAIIFACFAFSIPSGEFDKTIPFIISRVFMFIISLVLLKKCYELRNLTFQKYILAGSATYFVFGLLAFLTSILKVKLWGIEDIDWLFIGSIVDVVFFALGISYNQRKIIEEAIKNKILFEQEQKQNLQLSQMNSTLKTLNSELIVSEENLQNSNNSKEQLISMMSHDLLNPITAITNYNKQIINKKVNSEELLQAFKTVDAAIQPMQGLLDNMLQWTALQKQGIAAKYEQQDINEIIKEIIGIYVPQANLKSITISEDLQKDFVFKTDKSMVSLILRNLLNNAIKYSNHDTNILITSNADSKIITIKDEGFGMNHEMIGYLNKNQFEKIEAKGTGLGLKICYEFAHLIGVRIIFEKENIGTTVKIIFS